jgi:hypothetical protein
MVNIFFIPSVSESNVKFIIQHITKIVYRVNKKNLNITNIAAEMDIIILKSRRHYYNFLSVGGHVIFETPLLYCHNSCLWIFELCYW